MNRFVDNATKIFEAAESANASGCTLSDWTILVGQEGGIHLMADNDWSLESLLTERGAGMVYRVSQHGNRVRVSGRAGSRTCMFETGKPEQAARHLLADRPMYEVIPAGGARGPAQRLLSA